MCQVAQPPPLRRFPFFMSQYLLDTDTITLIHYGHPVLVQRLALHVVSEIAIAAISVQEQMRGWLARLNRFRQK